jgi:hypothetical protein
MLPICEQKTEITFIHRRYDLMYGKPHRFHTITVRGKEERRRDGGKEGGKEVEKVENK